MRIILDLNIRFLQATVIQTWQLYSYRESIFHDKKIESVIFHCGLDLFLIYCIFSLDVSTKKAKAKIKKRRSLHRGSKHHIKQGEQANSWHTTGSQCHHRNFRQLTWHTYPFEIHPPPLRPHIDIPLTFSDVRFTASLIYSRPLLSNHSINISTQGVIDTNLPSKPYPLPTFRDILLTSTVSITQKNCIFTILFIFSFTSLAVLLFHLFFHAIILMFITNGY